MFVGAMEKRRARRQSGETGLTLVEMLVTLAVILILVSVIVPGANFAVKREKELTLRRDLRMMRHAIDEYKKFCDAGAIQKEGVDSDCYPPDLDILVEGVERVGALGQKMKFLRRIPLDPMTKTYDWGKRSLQDEIDSTSWGGENVFDIYTNHQGTALDGSQYNEW
jgi:general secretion pathway protein G